METFRTGEDNPCWLQNGEGGGAEPYKIKIHKYSTVHGTRVSIKVKPYP